MITLTSAIAALAILAPMQNFAPAPQQQRVAPRGDYNTTCTAAYVNQGRLYADCRNSRGGITGTSISLDRCSAYPIRNDNGVLACGPIRGDVENRPGNGGGWPGNGNGNGGWPGNGGGHGGNNGGGWNDGPDRGEIIVYRDGDFRGGRMTFNRDVPDLGRTGFNDQISSMQFRGVWEACTDAYFRGQCQVFTDDVRNLSRWGMNDRISSLRRIRHANR